MLSRRKHGTRPRGWIAFQRSDRLAGGRLQHVQGGRYLRRLPPRRACLVCCPPQLGQHGRQQGFSSRRQLGGTPHDSLVHDTLFRRPLSFRQEQVLFEEAVLKGSLRRGGCRGRRVGRRRLARVVTVPGEEEQARPEAQQQHRRRNGPARPAANAPGWSQDRRRRRHGRRRSRESGEALEQLGASGAIPDRQGDLPHLVNQSHHAAVALPATRAALQMTPHRRGRPLGRRVGQHPGADGSALHDGSGSRTFPSTFSSSLRALKTRQRTVSSVRSRTRAIS